MNLYNPTCPQCNVRYERDFAYLRNEPATRIIHLEDEPSPWVPREIFSKD